MGRLVVVARRLLVNARRIAVDSASCIGLCCRTYRRAVLCPCEALPPGTPAHIWVPADMECTGPHAAQAIPDDTPGAMAADADAPGEGTV